MTQVNDKKPTGRVDTEACDQCGKCPSLCPVTARIEGFNPRQIMAKVALGREVDLMKNDVIWTCTSCFKVYDNKQRAIQATVGNKDLDVPVFYYTQLLGLAMGLGQEELGLELNQSLVDSVIERIGAV